MIENKPLVVIMGPTASGKTSLAVDVCKEINGEVVTADSMQVYKKMNIGTAKPTTEEMQGIKHHMIDLVNPDEKYSLGDYVKEAKKVIDSIYQKGKIPVLAGGTGLYIDTLIQGTVLSDGNSDEEYRKELYSLAQKNGNEFVHKMLEEVDLQSALSIHPNNLKRVIRALEFFKITNKKQSEHIREGKKESEYKLCKFCLFPQREALYDKINRRVDLMIDAGLVNEVKELLDMGIDTSCTSMQGIGYKEIALYLNGRLSLDEATDQVKMATRRYAKRQITWFKREENTNFVENSGENNLEYFVKSIELSLNM